MKNDQKATTPNIAADSNQDHNLKKAPPRHGKKMSMNLIKKNPDKVKSLVLEQISDGVLALDAAMNHIYLNEQAGELIGCKPEDLIGKNFWEQYPEATGTSFAEACRRALETQAIVTLDGYFPPSNTWLEGRVYPSAQGVSVIFSKGSEKKEEVDETHSLSRFPEQNPNPVMCFDSQGQLVYANPASGCLLALWKGTSGLDLPDDIKELLRSAVESGSNRETEIVCDGRIFAALLVPIHESGDVNVYCSDITERKQVEDERNELLQREQEQRASAEQARLEAEQAKIKAEKELTERKLAEAALGAWTDAPLLQEARPLWMRYGMALAVTAMAVLLRRFLDPVLGEYLQFTLLFAAIAFSVWYGGVGPAILAAVLGYIGISWFILDWQHLLALNVSSLTGLGVFTFSCVVVMALGDTMRRAQRHAHQSARVAVERQRQLEHRLTEQQQVEEALRESEQKFSLIYSKLPFAAALSRPEDGVLVDVNEEFENTFGYSRQDAIGKTSLQLDINPEEEVRVHILSELQTQYSAHEIELTLNTRPKGKRVFLMNIDLVRIGTEQFILQTAQDITERKQAEQEIRHLNAELHAQLDEMTALMEILPTGVWIGNHDCSVITGNAAAYEMMGLTPGINASVTNETAQTPVGLRLFVNDREVAPEDAPMQTVARTGKPIYNIEHELLFPNEIRKSVYASITPLFDRYGKVRKVIGAYTDISERKRNERALTEFAQQQTALYKLADRLHRANTLEEVFDASLDAISSALGCDRASILLFDETKVMHFVAWRGLSDEYRKATDGHSLWKYGEANPEPVFFNDIHTADLSDELKTVVIREEIGSLAFIPLVFQGNLLGKFMVYFNDPHEFNDSEIDLGLTIARQLAASVDRKRAEERLRASEEIYRRIVETANEGIWEVDKDTRTVFVNPRMAEMLGYTAEEMLGRSAFEFLLPEDQSEGNQRLEQAKQGSSSRATEFRYRRKDHSILWTIASNTPKRDEQGNFLGAVAMMSDITERKHAEEALRQSEERFAQFMEHLPGLAWIKDIDGRYVYANATAEKAFQTPRERLYGKTDTDIFPPQIATQFKRNDDQALKEGKGVQVVEELPQADGVLHYSLVSKFPMPGSDGKTALIGGTAFDITERKQAEEALKESQARYQELFNLVPIAVYTCNADGLLQEYNRRAVELWGRAPHTNDPAERYCGSFKMYYPDGRFMPHRECPTARVLRGETLEPHELEILIERRDGSFRNVISHPLPLKNERGEMIGAINCLYDMTERKEAEGRLVLLAEVSELMRNMEEPVELMSAVANLVGRHFKARRCLFNEIDVEKDIEIVHSDYHDGTESVVGVHKISDYSNVTSAEMMAGKTVVNVDSKTDARTAPDYERSYVSNGERAYVAVPLMREDRWVASLWLSDDAPRSWDKRDVDLLETIAERTWTATEKLRIHSALRESEERLRELNLKLEDRVERRTIQLKTASQLRRLEMAERRQAEDRFYKTFNASPAAMSITRFEDGMYRNVNPKFVELLEYDLIEIIGHTSLNLRIYRNDQERINLLKSIRNHDGKWEYETQLETKTGRLIDVTISIVEIEIEGESHLLSTILDITERKQMINALRSSEQQLRTLFSVLPVGVSYVRPDGQVIQSNPMLQQILGASSDHGFTEGSYHARKYIRPDGSPMLPNEFASIRALTEQHTIQNVETGIVKENGQVTWTSVSAAPVSSPEVGAVVITVDVTERKHMDDELRRSHKRYQVLSQRLVEIQEEERRTISRELHDRVGQSLAALNLNLNFLNSQFVQEGQSQQARSRLRDAIQLTEETVSTIRDVMADLRPPALDDYGLEAALNAYVSTFSRRSGIQVLPIKAGTSLPSISPSIELTLLRIAQEALTNVSRHSHANRVSITLGMEGRSIHLTIEDNGEGILSWQKANRPGSHGLKIMRERAEAFGGKLHIDSAHKKGTTIDVKIPIPMGDESEFFTDVDGSIE